MASGPFQGAGVRGGLSGYFIQSLYQGTRLRLLEKQAFQKQGLIMMTGVRPQPLKACLDTN